VPISRILYLQVVQATIISLGHASPRTSMQRNSSRVGDPPAASDRYRAVLLRMGFTARLRHRSPPWALTSRFHPYRRLAPTAVCFCGTFLRVTPTGR